MGDQKFPRKTYSSPRHPWEKNRIDNEREILEKFGLKNKKELWKSEAILASFRAQARDLQAKLRTENPYARHQFDLLIGRLNRLSILGEKANLDDVLSLNLENVLDRRLQTIVHKKGLSRTVGQARQLITHGHVLLNGRRVTIPGVLVERSQEESVQYNPDSPVNDEMHPIRRSLASGKEETPPAEEAAAKKEEEEIAIEEKSGDEKKEVKE